MRMLRLEKVSLNEECLMLVVQGCVCRLDYCDVCRSEVKYHTKAFGAEWRADACPGGGNVCETETNRHHGIWDLGKCSSGAHCAFQ